MVIFQGLQFQVISLVFDFLDRIQHSYFLKWYHKAAFSRSLMMLLWSVALDTQ